MFRRLPQISNIAQMSIGEDCQAIRVAFRVFAAVVVVVGRI